MKRRIRSRHPAFRWSILVLFLLALFATGCGDGNIFNSLGDKDSKEAKTEEALLEMDQGNYSAAASILNDLVNQYPEDSSLLQYLGSAYSGLAGLDIINLLKIIDELDKAGDTGSIDMAGRVLGDESGILTQTGVENKLLHLIDAISTLERIAIPDDDQLIQTGVVSVAHLSLLIGGAVMTDLGLTEIPLTEEGITSLYGGQPADFSAVTEDTLADIDDDIARIGNAIDALSRLSPSGNELADNFEEFRDAIDLNHDDHITREELESYINNL